MKDHIELLAALELRNQIFTIRHVQASPRDRITVSVLRKFIIQTRRGDTHFPRCVAKEGFQWIPILQARLHGTLVFMNRVIYKQQAIYILKAIVIGGFKIYLVSTLL